MKTFLLALCLFVLLISVIWFGESFLLSAKEDLYTKAERIVCDGAYLDELEALKNLWSQKKRRLVYIVNSEKLDAIESHIAAMEAYLRFNCDEEFESEKNLFLLRLSSLR